MARPQDCSSPVMVIANQDEYDDEDYAAAPTIAQIEETAREVGEFIGKQEVVTEADKDVLIDILLAVSQLAFDTENALLVEDVDGQPNDDISKFFENSLNFTKIFILQPMVAAMKSSDANTNVRDFKKICESAMGLWSVTVENISDAYVLANERLKKVFEHVFNQETELASD